jgi:two-component system sensor histidine kinase YesM
MRLKNKLMLVNGVVIAIIIFTAMVAVFLVANYTLTANSITASRNLLEQMGGNLEYILSAVEETVFVQVIHSDLSFHLRRSSMSQAAGRTVAAMRSTSNFAYNLIGYNRNFLSVTVADMQGNIYGYAASRLKNITDEDARRNMVFERAQGLWGKAFWHIGPDGLLHMDRAIFDMASMEMMGVVSIGIKPELLRSHFQGILENDISGVVLLNADGQIFLESDLARGGPAVREFPPNIEQGGTPVYYRGRAYTLARWWSATEKFSILQFIDQGLLIRQSIRILVPLVYSALMAGSIALLIALLSSRGISQGVEHLELKALQFEYDSLLARINPHFLYNTLEGINSLAKISGQRNISESICLLGNYLRQTVNTEGPYIRLSRELANLEDYIKILRLSFPWPIRLETDIDEALEETVVPKLILQPLVENAVIHGLARKKQGGCILFSASCAGKDMLVRIQDNGEGMAGSGAAREDGSPRIGMSTVHKRLQILYGEQYGLQVENLPGSGVCVTLRLPILFEDEIAGRAVTEERVYGSN